jgi:lauroyl/myristoyl acyltransferase
MSLQTNGLAQHNGTSLDQHPRPPLIASGDVRYMAVLILAAGLNVLPSAMRARIISQLSRAVSALWYRTNRGGVRHVRHHLQVLFDYAESDTELESLVRSQLVLATWNALIINLLPSLHEKHLDDLLRIEGLPHIDEIKRQGKGVLLLGFHYGAYGFAVAGALAAQGHRTRLVAYGDSYTPRLGTSRFYQRFYWPQVQRLIQNIKVITVDPDQESQPELCKVLERKDEIVHLLADQYFVIPPTQRRPEHLVPLRFLERTVYLDTSGVRLAKQMGAQPLMAISVKEDDRQRVLIEPFEWASGGTTIDDIARDLQLYMSRLERQLLTYPAWWRDLRRTDLLARVGVSERQGPALG